jgi:hypothetical protein
MDPIQSRPYSGVSTDTILSQTMEGVGDHDPSTIKGSTGKLLHFDATRSADVHRAGNTSNSQGVKNAVEAGIDQAKEKVVDRLVDGAAEMAGKFGPAISGTAFVLGSVAQLGSLYYSGIEKAHREGESQQALGASDAGVVAMTQSLDYDSSFKSVMSVGHNGSSNVAAAMTVSLNGNTTEKAELQLRSDKGFVDAAGFARTAASQMKPFVDDGNAKLAQAKMTTDPKQASALRAQATASFSKAADVEKKVMAPVMGKAQSDAAYGLGVMYAVHCAVTQTPATFDKTFAKANSNVQSVSPSTIFIQG